MAGVQIDGVNNKIDFDDDLDTSISANTDDTLVIEAGGNTMATITATTFTINDGTTITTADNTDTLTLTSTDADANVGPNLRLYRNSASPADSDDIGAIRFDMRNDNSQDFTTFQMTGDCSDVSDGTEDAEVHFDIMTAGTLREYMRMASGSTPNVVFNEGSQDFDFRVESNGNANMLFVDGGENHVGIGTNAPKELLHIEDAAPILRISDSNSTAEDNAVGKIQFFDRNNTDLTAEIIAGTGSLSDLILSAHNNRALLFQTNGNTERFRIGSAGTLSTGAETAPDVGAGGLTLQQNAIDTNILTLKSSDVAHGMTSIEETDSYGIFKKNAANDGGLRIISTSGGAIAFKHEAFATGSNTAESSSATSGWAVDVRKKNGTSVAGLADDDNLASFRQSDQSQLIIKGNGELFSNSTGTVSTFDAYEDAQLVRAFDLSHMRGVINSNFDKFVQYNKDDLQKAKLIGTDEEGNATPMVNITGMQRLHNGAIWQQYEKHQRLAEAVYEMAKETLGEDKADAILKKHDIKLLN